MLRHNKSADAATGLDRCPSTTMEALGPLAAVPALQYRAETSKSAFAGTSRVAQNGGRQ